MIVKVKLFATLTRHAPAAIRDRFPQGLRSGTAFELELPENSSLADLVSQLELPTEQVKIIFVNGRTRKSDYRIQTGDEIGLFPPIGGG